MAKRLTKAQQAKAAAEAREAAMHAALAWPDYPEPAPLTGGEMDERVRTAWDDFGSGIARAWTYNTHTPRVSHGCFSSVSHAFEGGKTRSQTRGGPWFDTEEDAYRALRWAVTRRFAEELAALNARIAQALSSRSPL